jgi:hypothetical protein
MVRELTTKVFASGTSFSREDASTNTINFAVRHPTLSRLKPVPLSELRSACTTKQFSG